MSNNVANHTESRREDWGTPPELFAKLATAHDFVIDLCANEHNSLCDLYIDEQDDLLSARAEKIVEIVAAQSGCLAEYKYAWINPPYQSGGKTGLFVARAAELCLQNTLGLVALVPASVGSRWWRECVDPFFDFVIFTPRLRFAGAPGSAQFDTAICVMHPLDKTGPDPAHFELGAVYKRQWAHR